VSAASIPVAVLGGGAYAARLVEVLAASPDLPALDVRLHARDRERLAAIAGHAAARLRALGSAHAARACLELDDALDGAAAVVLLVRVGGLAARAHDEGFPGRFGHVGDEGVGLGGIANAWRTVPVLAAIAERIAERAPGAHVLNMMAPLGVTTRLLAERGLRAVGLCELPTVTAARWRSEAIRDPDAPLALAGLNHLAFFWSESAGPLDHPVLRVAIERGEVPAELAYRLAAVPLHYYIDVFQAEAARRLGRRRQSGRAAALTALRDDLVRDFRAAPGAAVADLARRPTPWFDLAVVPALAAVLDGPPYHGPLDSTGGGVLAEAPAPVVVELLGVLDAGGVRFDPVPARPPAVAEAIGHLAGAEDLVYRASVARDRGLLLDALAALPLAIDPAAHPAMADAICFPVGEEAAR
jgi:6-phospho-beta-glucosidase